MRVSTSRKVLAVLTSLGLGSAVAWAQDQKANTPPAAPALEPIPKGPALPKLKTVPVPRTGNLRGLIVVDSSPLPRDEINRRNAVAPGVDPEKLPPELQKFWVLDFAFKPVRMMTIETPRGRRQVYYLYYRVINRTGQPRNLAPQFTLVTDDGKAYPDTVLPRAVDEIERRERPKGIRAIEAREDPLIPLHGAVEIVGELPPTGNKEGVDDAVFGVAVWEMDETIARADQFHIDATGLSNGYLPEKSSDGAPVIRYKTLRLHFASPGDERDRREEEIRVLDPPYTWEYPLPAGAKPKAAVTKN